VHSTAAERLQARLAWTRNGRGFALLSSACEGSSPLPVDALLHIAGTLTMQP